MRRATTLKTRQELIEAIKDRYRRADQKEKKIIPHEFVKSLVFTANTPLGH
jgi:hypothetical protein